MEFDQLMLVAYRPESWQTLFTAIASSTAALTGLLFIALSLHLRVIVRQPAYIALARETLGTLISLLLLSILMLIPGQPLLLLGIELVVGGFILIAVSLMHQPRTLKNIEPARRGRWLLRLGLLNLGTLSPLIAGLSLISISTPLRPSLPGGLFWLVPTMLIYTLWPLSNAWMLVVQIARQES